MNEDAYSSSILARKLTQDDREAEFAEKVDEFGASLMTTNIGVVWANEQYDDIECFENYQELADALMKFYYPEMMNIVTSENGWEQIYREHPELQQNYQSASEVQEEARTNGDLKPVIADYLFQGSPETADMD